MGGSDRDSLGNLATARAYLGPRPSPGTPRGTTTDQRQLQGKKTRVRRPRRENARERGAGPRARAASKPRPTWAPSRDAGAPRGEARSRLVGYLPPRGRACVGQPGRPPRLVEQAHACWPSAQLLEEPGRVGEARGVRVGCAGVFSPASSLGAVRPSKGDLD